MTANEHMTNGLKANLGMLQSTLADFSDADLLARPVPAANHPNWQLGHLLKAENGMLRMAGAKMPELPAGVAEKYTNDTAKSDNAAAFLKKDELFALIGQTREASIAFAASLTAEQLEAAAPENVRRLAPTVGDLVVLISIHTAMHVGQFQVARRKLGKPILF